MSDEVLIRADGRAGRITLNRPQALNALTWAMCRAIDRALIAWRDDPSVALVLIDGAGTRAFCAGGDVAEIHAAGRRGDDAFARAFWADEYRMNARIAAYPKPVVSFLQGFTMGGGVGLGCHAGHRIVGESAQVAMPECAIGLVPDVGGSWLLSRAPGRLGAYLGMTGARMGPGDAILAGFADLFVPEAAWDEVKVRLCAAGRTASLAEAAADPPPGLLAARRGEIGRLFSAPTAARIVTALETAATPFAAEALARIRRNSPLAVAAFAEMLNRLSPKATLAEALALEYRFTWRAQAQADFLEGIRALVIDKDRSPRWHHGRIEEVTPAETEALLAPLGPDELALGPP
jgi:enoyl-CoA hydratase/carnithine racemase